MDGEQHLRTNEVLIAANLTRARHQRNGSYAPASAASAGSASVDAVDSLLHCRRRGPTRAAAASSTWSLADLSNSTQPAGDQPSWTATVAAAAGLRQLAWQDLVGTGIFKAHCSAVPQLVAALQPDSCVSHAWGAYCAWLLPAMEDALVKSNGTTAATKHVFGAQHAAPCYHAWSWLCAQPEVGPISRPPFSATTPLVPARGRNTTAAEPPSATMAEWQRLGQSACLVHSYVFAAAARVGVLRGLLLPAAQPAAAPSAGRPKKQPPKQQPALPPKEATFELFSNRTACSRVTGWALHSTLQNATNLAKRSKTAAASSQARLVEELIEARTDGCFRRSFDDDLLPSLKLGRIVTPKPSITDFFEGLQRGLISHVKSASSVLRGGPLVVQGWIDEVRYDLAAWGSFQAACASAGVSVQHSNAQQQQHYSLADLRALMGVLVTKYVHANLEGLLRHLKVLVQADKASDRALRDERRADAATAAKKGKATTAAGGADGQRRGRKTAAPAAEAPEVESADEPDSSDGSDGSDSSDCESTYGDDFVCQLCNEPEPADAMLLCDSCDKGYHNFCLTPRVDGIPDGQWFCPNCAQLAAPAAAIARKRAVDAMPAEAKRTRSAAAAGAERNMAASGVGAAAAGGAVVAVVISAGAAGLATGAAVEPLAPKRGRAKRGLPAEAPPAQREGARKRLPSVRLND